MLGHWVGNINQLKSTSKSFFTTELKVIYLPSCYTEQYSNGYVLCLGQRLIFQALGILFIETLMVATRTVWQGPLLLLRTHEKSGQKSWMWKF